MKLLSLGGLTAITNLRTELSWCLNIEIYNCVKLEKSANHTGLFHNMVLLWSYFTNLFLNSSSFAADVCQPPWILNAMREVIPGQIICRYTLTSPNVVNDYTCRELANKWDISIETFFKLNPDVDRNCMNIKPGTEYCVAGCPFTPLFHVFSSHFRLANE